jgi:hypothetical protein
MTSFIKNAHFNNEEHTVVLFLFNHDTTIHTFKMNKDGVESITRCLGELKASGGTNMIKVCHELKSYYDASSNKDNIIVSFMSDGHHYMKDMPIEHLTQGDTELSRFTQHIFSHVGAIGTTRTVDERAMTHFTNGRHGVLDYVNDEQSVSDTFSARYFEILSSQECDATVQIICHNNEDVIPIDEVTTTYLSHDEFLNMNVDTFPESSSMAFEQGSGVYVVRSIIEHSELLKSSTPKEYVFALDYSGSMDETVIADEPVYKESSIPDRTKPYVCHTGTFAHITPFTEIPGGGHVVAVIVTSTNTKTHEVTTTRLPITTTLSDTIMDMYSTMLNLFRTVSHPITEKELHVLYKSNLDIPTRLKNMPSNLRTMGEVIWTSIRNRYRSTLSKGELFFDQTPMALNIMTAMSSNASAESPSAGHDHRQVIQVEDDRLCNLCFERPKEVLVPNCGQIGSCKACFIKWINESVKPLCPFCKCDVTGWTPLDVSEGILCRDGCGKKGNFICENRHMLYCDTCIKKHESSKGVVCPQCPERVKKVCVYVM